MTRLPWKSGPLHQHAGPSFVSATRFTYDTTGTLLCVFWHGLRLRSTWPRIEGAVGLSIMADVRTRSTYTLSVWGSYADLQAWVRTAPHASLMSTYRKCLVDSAFAGWEVAHLDLRACWRQALDRIGA
jgi:hypothetical protein